MRVGSVMGGGGREVREWSENNWEWQRGRRRALERGANREAKDGKRKGRKLTYITKPGAGSITARW